MKKIYPLFNTALIVFGVLYIIFGTISHLDPIPSNKPVWAVVGEVVSIFMVFILGIVNVTIFLILRFKKHRTKAELERMQETFEILYAVADTMMALKKDNVKMVLKGGGVDALIIPEEKKRMLEQKLRKLLLLPEEEEKSKDTRREIGEILVEHV